MKIMITGNMGYIGPVLYPIIHDEFPGASIRGFDSGYFAHCLTNAEHLPECGIDRQFFGDMRDFPAELLDPDGHGADHRRPNQQK